MVKKGPLDISIVERGNLESSANIQLTSRVEGVTTIIKIAEEGSAVKEGDLLVELDSSKLKTDAIQQEITVKNAEAAEEQAKLNLDIQETQNASDIAAAQLKLDLAILDLEKYEKGDYIQLQDQIKGERTLAGEALTRAQDLYNFSKRQAMKGYVTQTKLESDRIAVTKAEIDLDVANKKLEVLDLYDFKRQTKEKQANAAEFVREVERVKRKAEAALTQYKAAHAAAKLTASVERTKYDRMLNQIAACTMKAPQDGLVVYANERSSRGGGGGDSVMIQEGAQVRERQAIINLPDISKMRVNARVHESKIDMLREGLPVRIKVDARPGEVFHGEVDNVSLVPLSGNWPNYNLKEYATTIAIKDDPVKVQALKPGLTAEVEVLVARLESVLQVPIQGVVEQAGKHFAFVLGKENKIERRQTTIGKTNEVMMEIKDGLAEGETIVLNPRAVLSREIAQLEIEFPVNKLPAAEKFGDGKPPTGDEPRSSGDANPDVAKKKAQSKGAGGTFDPAARFVQQDANKDGKLSEDEVSERMRPRFAEYDKNGDKFLDQAEYVAIPRNPGGGGAPGGGAGPGAQGGGGRQPGGAQ